MADGTQQAGFTEENQLEPPAMKVSVIMPVYNAVDYITQSLPPLIEMLHNDEILEVIVVDDSSADETPVVAARIGAQVLPSGGRLGPGGSRNRAAETARGDILWFVDADVVMEKGSVHRLIKGFSEPDVVAVFGSYDDQPPAQNFLSQYKNLIHHYYHNLARREASTFWSGCGAVRKDAFMQVGGFDVTLFTESSGVSACGQVEDIDLGYRLRDAGGRILLLSELRGTHLKEWRFLNLLRTDIFCRAIPWARLMLTRTGLDNDLNVSNGERIRAGLAGLLVLALACAMLGVVSWWLLCAVGFIVALANRRLFAFFYGCKRLGFALRATLFHQLYYLYSGFAFVWCWIEVKILRLHQKQAAT